MENTQKRKGKIIAGMDPK
jgi:hypothetical protein